MLPSARRDHAPRLGQLAVLALPLAQVREAVLAAVLVNVDVDDDYPARPAGRDADVVVAPPLGVARVDDRRVLAAVLGRRLLLVGL